MRRQALLHPSAAPVLRPASILPGGEKRRTGIPPSDALLRRGYGDEGGSPEDFAHSNVEFCPPISKGRPSSRLGRISRALSHGSGSLARLQQYLRAHAVPALQLEHGLAGAVDGLCPGRRASRVRAPCPAQRQSQRMLFGDLEREMLGSVIQAARDDVILESPSNIGNARRELHGRRLCHRLTPAGLIPPALGRSPPPTG